MNMRVALLLRSAALDRLLERLGTMGANAQSGLIDAVLALGVALLAWALAAVLAWLLRRVLRAARFDDAVRGLVGAGMLGSHEPSMLAAWAVYWSVVVLGTVVAFDTLGFKLSEALTNRLDEVLPRVLAAGILTVAGVVMAMALGLLTRRFFETAGLSGGRARGMIVTTLFTSFTALLVLDQLGFAAQFVMAVGVVLAGAIGLGVALAFGLGCRDLARDCIVEYLRSLESDGRPRP